MLAGGSIQLRVAPMSLTLLAPSPEPAISASPSLTREQKQKVAEEITATLERHAGKPASYTYIAFEELPEENWAIAGKLLDEDD